mgnify:CR=1 FL=1
MNKLTVKLNVFEKRLVMQVIDQAEELRGSSTNPKEFKASNGIVIVSGTRPGIFPDLKQISLRGENKLNDLDVVYGLFESTDEAKLFMQDINVAMSEYLDNVRRSRNYKLVKNLGESIKLNQCEVLFSPLKNAIVMQLISSNFECGNDHMENSDDLKVDITNGIHIALPFNSTDSYQTMISTKGKSEDEVKSMILDIIDILNYSDSPSVQSFENKYPESIYSA